VTRIVTLLNQEEIAIESISIHKPTLEDVFLYFTGKTIREQEADGRDTMRMYQRMMRR
jgi:ABC-2 type transport system ATP-binding protein